MSELVHHSGAQTLDLSALEPFPSSIVAHRNRWGYLRAKRTIDLVAAIASLVLLTPLLLFIALLIKLDSRGPVLFNQERVGYRWRPEQLRVFRFHKFRSMVHGCDQTIHEHHVHTCLQATTHGEDGTEQVLLTKIVNDSRVTRVGRILRRTSLDELPQLWNVIKGDMSLVGPRPVPIYEVAEYEPWHYQRLQATPGITGLWQVKGRGRTSLDDMVQLDIEYINNQSAILDLEILLLTIPAVVRGTGAG